MADDEAKKEQEGIYESLPHPDSQTKSDNSQRLNQVFEDKDNQMKFLGPPTCDDEDGALFGYYSETKTHPTGPAQEPNRITITVSSNNLKIYR